MRHSIVIQNDKNIQFYQVPATFMISIAIFYPNRFAKLVSIFFIQNFFANDQ